MKAFSPSLYSALLSGLEPDVSVTHRLQLFFVANIALNSRSHQADFQRALETAIEKQCRFAYAADLGLGTKGECVLTSEGHNRARALFGEVEPRYSAVRRADFRCRMAGSVGGAHLELRTSGVRTSVSIDGEKTASAVQACRHLEKLLGIQLPTDGESAVRVLQDLAIDRGLPVEIG